MRVSSWGILVFTYYGHGLLTTLFTWSTNKQTDQTKPFNPNLTAWLILVYQKLQIVQIKWNIGLQFLASGLSKSGAFHEMWCFSYEKQCFLWKVALFIWKAPEIIKNSWFNTHLPFGSGFQCCFLWKVLLFVKSTTLFMKSAMLFMKSAMLFVKSTMLFTVSFLVITKYRSFFRKTKKTSNESKSSL